MRRCARLARYEDFKADGGRGFVAHLCRKYPGLECAGDFEPVRTYVGHGRGKRQEGTYVEREYSWAAADLAALQRGRDEAMEQRLGYASRGVRGGGRVAPCAAGEGGEYSYYLSR